MTETTKFPDWCPWQEKFEKAKREAIFVAKSRDHAWEMLQIANARLRKNGLDIVANTQELP